MNDELYGRRAALVCVIALLLCLLAGLIRP